MLHAEGLRFGYGANLCLDGVDFIARSGKVTAIVGPNGAGKTTLLRLLAGTLTPQAGQVTLQGRDLAGLRRRAIAREIASSPQFESTEWPLTVEQTVLLGRAAHRGWLAPMTRQDRDLGSKALEAMNLTALAERPLTELSGGEHRRVLFARILTQEPKVVLLDEPTAHLDLRHQEEVLRQMTDLARKSGIAVVATLHDLNQTAAYADSVALLHGRRLQAQGAPDEVFTAPRLLDAYGLEMTVARHPGTGRLWLSPAGR